MAEKPRTDGDKPKPKKPREYLADLGYALELINSDPSLQVFITRVRQYMDKNKDRVPTAYELEEMKQGIDWFERFNADQERARMMQADPRRRADWQRSLQLEEEKVRNIATAYGAPVPDAIIKSIALDARLDGLTEQEIRNRMRPFLESAVTGAGGELTGAAENAERDLLQWSRRNGLTLSGDVMNKYVRSAVEGVQSMDSIKDDLRRTYLMGQYPAWADRIQQGFDPADIAGPYKSRMAAILELDEESIDLNDELLQRGMQGIGADGKPKVTPLYQFDREIRNDERWQFTDNAKSTYSNMADQVLRMFGFR